MLTENNVLLFSSLKSTMTKMWNTHHLHLSHDVHGASKSRHNSGSGSSGSTTRAVYSNSTQRIEMVTDTLWEMKQNSDFRVSEIVS